MAEKDEIAKLGYDWCLYFHANCKSNERYRCDVIERSLEAEIPLAGQGSGSTEREAVKNALKDLLRRIC